MKSKTIAALLAIFLGGFGAHKFYLGKTWQGILYFVLVWTWVPAVIGLFEGILLFTKSQDEFDAEYNALGKINAKPSAVSTNTTNPLSNEDASKSTSDFQNASRKKAEFIKKPSVKLNNLKNIDDSETEEK